MKEKRSVFASLLAVTKTNVYEFQNHTLYAQNREQVFDYLSDVPLFEDDEENVLLVKEVKHDKYIVVKQKDVVETESGFILSKVIEDTHLPIAGFFDTRTLAEQTIEKY